MHRKMTLLVVKNYFGTLSGSLSTVLLNEGTILEASKIVNNGTSFLAYECNFNGQTIYVKPTIGFVQEV